MSSVSNLMAQVAAFQNDPTRIQTAVLQTLSDVTNGTIQVVDATNPFVFSLESSAVLIATWMSESAALTRKQYPIASRTQEDLFAHMADNDFIGIYALPATTTLTLAFKVDELLNGMVMDTTLGYRKLVIPRNSFVTVSNTKFSIQYPIEMRQLAHGGIQVLYNVDKVSPLQSLTTNFIDSVVNNRVDGEWLIFDIEVQQFNILNQEDQLSSAVNYVVNIPYRDQYYYTRVYVSNSSGGWTEIKTTYTPDVYDANVPTAVISVANNSVSILIPQIYTAYSLRNKMLRIDIYETKGPLSMVLSEYQAKSFVATWISHDVTDMDQYVAPLKNLKTVVIFSDTEVYGGRDPLSFNEIYDRVIAGAVGTPNIPITNVAVADAISDAGYKLVKNIDIVTNRVFLATKPMPAPVNTNLLTRANATITTLSTTMTAAVLSNGVIDNGYNITFTPDTIYKVVNGVLSIVSNNELDKIKGYPVEAQAAAITESEFLYSPFHYVLDTMSNTFDFRAYYLDNPVIKTKIFVAENNSTTISVSTGTYTIARTNTGFVLQVITKSNDLYRQLSDDAVYVQLAFVPYGEVDRAYLNGELVGKTGPGERIYHFDLSTNFNVDKFDNLELTQFKMFTTEPKIVGTTLTNTFDIIYATTVVTAQNWRNSAVDNVLGRVYLPKVIHGLSQEQLNITFGYALHNLWARARSVISSTKFRQWPTDAYRYYETDVYVQDENGAAITFDSTGNPVMNILHRKGDLVLNDANAVYRGNWDAATVYNKNDAVIGSNGKPYQCLVDGTVGVNQDPSVIDRLLVNYTDNWITITPMYKHRQFEVMLDNAGNPIIEDDRDILRQLDIFLLECAYLFATDPSAISYRQTLVQIIVNDLINGLSDISGKLLEKTRIYFYPKTTVCSIDVSIENNIVKSIDASHSFNVILRVLTPTYNNIALRDKLAKTTIQIIADELDQATVSLDEITAKLRAAYSGDVVSVEVSGLGGINKLQAFTVIDESKRCSIRKRLVAQPNNTLLVEEDVTISFLEMK